MGTISNQIKTAFRDFVTQGVSSSGPHEVVKAEVRAIGPLIEAALGAVSLSSVDVIKDTRANLNADLAYPADAVALVYGDATDANNDLYIKVGASGSGSWTLTSNLHDIIEGIAKPFSDLAEAWAQGTEPGGGGTKSAKEHAEDAESAAALIAPNGNDSIRLGSGGASLTTGARNIIGGVGAANAITISADSTVLGYRAGEVNSAINASIVLGSFAAYLGTGAITNSVVLGAYSALSFAGSDMVAVGHQAFVSATANRGTAVGSSAGATTTTAFGQSLFGFNAQGGATNDYAMAFGYSAACTAPFQISMGTADTTNHMRIHGRGFNRVHPHGSGDNWWLLSTGPANAPSGEYNLGIGIGALPNVTDGYNNLAVGPLSGVGIVGGENTIFHGAFAGQFCNADISDSVLVGVKAGQYGARGAGFTAVGYRSGQMNLDGTNCSALGDSTLWLNQGAGAVAMGYTAGEFIRDGAGAVLIGVSAGAYRLNAQNCIYIGANAGAIASNQSNCDISETNFLADKATLGLSAAIAAAGGEPAGRDNVGIGFQSLMECLGSRVTAIGTNAGGSLIGVANETLSGVYIGFNCGLNASQKANAFNQIVIGQQAWGDRDNQVVLGGTGIAETVLRGVTRHTTYTVATLPSAATMGAGARAFATDATATTFASIVAGGGPNSVPVYSDGTNWRIG